MQTIRIPCSLFPSPRRNIRSVSTKANKYGFRDSYAQVTDQMMPKSFFSYFIEHCKDEFQLANTQPSGPLTELQQAVLDLTLSNEGIWERERRGARPESPLLLYILYKVICYTLDTMYADKPTERFFVLETLARMPYFSFVSMMHMYETLGFWSLDGKLKMFHTTEELNESCHLRVMEALGGGKRWKDRFLARHLAIGYYLLLNFIFLFSPKLTYNISELLESHAVSTYEQFIEENKERLKKMPAPEITDPWYARWWKPSTNLHDVFSQILRDEKDHSSMMGDLKSRE